MPYLPRSLRNLLGSDATDTSVIAELDPEDKPRPLPLASAEGYLEQLLKGLSDVHKAGLVHRDIKPANLAGLSAEELEALIAQVAVQQASQSPQQKAFQQRVANINNSPYTNALPNAK